MRLTVTADDFGWSQDTVEATVRALESGAVTNASLMPAAPRFALAADYAARRQEHCYGVHLTLGGDGIERPVAPPGRVASLLGGDGAFLPARRVRRRALAGRLDVGAVETELRAQLDAVLGRGVRIDYVDSHKHLHKLPVVLRTLLRILPDYGVRRLRKVQDVWLKRPLTSPTFWAGPLLWPRTPEGFVSSDRFYMPATLDETGWAPAIVARRTAGVLEVGVHPGVEDPWRAAEARDAEALAAAAKQAGVEIVPWRQVGQAP